MFVNYDIFSHAFHCFYRNIARSYLIYKILTRESGLECFLKAFDKPHRKMEVDSLA